MLLSTEPPSSRSRLTRSAGVAGWVTLAIGALGAIGWVANLPALTRLLPGWTSMRLTTAASFMLAGAALVELSGFVAQQGRRLAARLAAALVALGGFWSCAEQAFGMDPRLERALLAWVIEPAQPRSPSPVTALSFALLGLSLLELFRPGKRASISQASAVGVALTALLALIVYAYGEVALRTIEPFSSIAAPSALGSLSLSLGVLCAWGKAGPLHVFAGSGLGSVLARRALPLAVAIPLLAGWLSLNGDRLGLFTVEFAMALVALSNTAIFVVLIYAGGWWLNRIDARRAASEAHLERSERHFRALAESLPQLAWTCEGSGSCDYLSPQWVAYTGLPEQEQLGSKWLSQIHPDDRAFTITSWNTAATEGGVFDIELRIRRHDGVYRWFKTRATPLCERGRVLKWFGSNTDIQDLRDARDVLEQVNQSLERRVHERTQELSRALERVRLATAAANMGIWDWDVRDNVLVWDETMYQVYGIAPQSFHDALDAWRATVHPEDLSEFERNLQRALTSGADFDTSFRIVRPDQQVRYIRGTGVAHAGPDGRTSRIVGVNLDVTAQRAAESALRANEALLREFVKHAPAAIAMLDRDVRYLQASDRWLTDYRLDSQDIIGRSHYEVFPDVPQRWRDVHQRVLRGSVEKCDEDPFPRADGRMEWLQWEARPWRLADGDIGGVLFFTQVITARKEMEIELLERRAELERSNQDLEQFAYVASHDLQEPLRAVSGCGQILKRRYGEEGHPDTMAVQLIDHMVEGAARMQTLILDLLAFSRVGARGHELAPVDSGEALKRAIQQLDSALNETNARVEVKHLPRVTGDAEQITQLFQNLMGNALKYRGKEPVRIEIDAQASESGYEFSVRDNGIGIEPQYFEKIFVLFQRLHTREEYPGTGIGLSICKKIVERHGGRIWVESAVGQGSAFHFTLPREDQAPRV